MQLQCPNCRQRVLAEDVELSAQLAKCRACHTVFSFAEQLARNVPAAPVEPFRPRAPLEPPSKFRVDDWGGTLTVRWRWFGYHLLFLLFFCCIWDGFLVVWYTIGIATKAPIVMLVFPVLHVAVGVGLSYYVLAGFLNKTTLKLDGVDLSVSHGPLPWRGAFSLPAGEIDQLYCFENKIYNKGSVRYEYELRALLRSGGERTIVKSLHDSQQALYLEQMLEDRLQVVDRPVEGELPRR